MTSTTEKDSAISGFVSCLEQMFSESRADGTDNKMLNRAGRAILKRNAGKTLAESHRALPVFFSLNPPELWQDEQLDGHECAWLVATLYCSMKGRRGASLADELRFVADRDDKARRPGLERRMAHLLECRTNEELAFRLRQITKLLESQKRGLDWRQLLKDLTNWYHPERFVQKRWANAFFRTTDLNSNKTEISKGNDD